MQTLADRLDRVLDHAIAAHRVVGATVLVARHGELVYHRATGLADRDAGRRMTEATPHRLASMTKPITALAALALVERGALALDQPVTRWLPDFTPRLGDRAPTITLHHLLTHTSGLGYTFNEPPGGPYHEARVSDGLDQPGLGLAENLRRLASVPLRFAPGTDFTYSLGLDVIGAVLERAADALAVPYADGAPPEPIHDGTAVPLFPPLVVTFAPSRALDPASYASGGAGIVGTAAAYLRLLEALRTRRIPRVTGYDRLFTDQIASLVPATLDPGTGYTYAGAYVRDPRALQSALRPGAVRWGGAYGHSWAIDPSTATTHVLVTNTAFEGMTGALRREVEAAVHA